MPRKLNHAAAAWLLGICFILLGIPAFAESPGVEEVLGVLGMDKGQIAELAQGQPIAYALSEGRDDELAVGVAWYLPVPLSKVAGHLRQVYPESLDIDVTAHGMLTEHGGADSLAPVVLSKEEAQALLDAEPGTNSTCPRMRSTASKLSSGRPIGPSRTRLDSTTGKFCSSALRPIGAEVPMR